MAHPFEILGLAPSFALDPSVLEQRQRELNRALHPDRHAGKSPAERRQALSRAMDINLAYRTLRDPASRAEALFSLLGAPSTRESTVSDPGLLMEMMEQREALEEARRAKNHTQLEAIGRSMAERERVVLGRLESAFAPLLAGPPSAALSPALSPGAREAQLVSARQLLAELRYVRRFAEEIAAFEDD